VITHAHIPVLVVPASPDVPASAFLPEDVGAPDEPETPVSGATASRGIDALARYVVLEARNGREALEILDRPEHGIHLVLTDVIMPDMGGLELSRRISGAHPDVRIVFMSGYTEGDKLQPGVRNSPYPFLQKPFSAENLAIRIREALDRATR
jgi:DNA-binding NtrC family response regulator